jgi:hypothetical protein
VKGKILFVAGLAVGYVLGAKAGRQRYEQIKTRAEKLWNSPGVQERVEQVGDFVKDKAPDVAEFVTDNAKKVASQVKSRRSSTSGVVPGSTTTSTSSKPASTTE